MNYLFNEWEKIERKLENKNLFIFLDYDGTLAPIADTPQDAVIPSQTKKSLQELSMRPDCALAVISGRSLEDLKDTVGIEDIIYVGNHGLEIEGPKIRFESPLAQEYRIILGQIKESLAKRLYSIKSAMLEDKGLSLSIHYRLVDKDDIAKVEAIVYGVSAPYSLKNKVKIKNGKKVLEITPPSGQDKGKAVLWLLARQKFILKNKPILPVYIGDDISDEDAFRALRDKGLTIFVGNHRQSQAQYYLKDTKEVYEFLKRIL